MSQIDLSAQIRSVAREIKMREQVYPRWVTSGKMRPENADYEIAAMKAVLATLVGLQASQPLLT